MAMVHKALPLNGSANLNFSIVGGTSAPTKSKENTIWVNTDVKIPKWSLDGKEPTSPIVGQVWIKIVNSDGYTSFNALKKENTINIQLHKTYQWNGTEWNEVKGMVFHNGKWTQISGFVITYLYDHGTQNVVWAAVEGGYGSGSTTFNSDSVKLDSTGSYGSGGRYQSVYTLGKINLTEYTKLKAVVSGCAYGHEGIVLDGMDEHNGFFRMGITTAHNTNIKAVAVRTINLNPQTETNAEREVIMDISDITGEYYIGICIMAYRMYDYSNSGYVYSVSLHKD